MTRATAASLGTNVSVTSWIWVTDWNSEMARPMARLVMRIGAETLAVTIIILIAISITAVSFIVRPAPGGGEGGGRMPHRKDEALEASRGGRGPRRHCA